jgi:mono/diheme cytochrome c family protein
MYRVPLSALAVGLALAMLSAEAVAGGDAGRGAYILTAAGCVGCHTTPTDKKAGVILAGGRALKTPFGTYYSPNITPDPEHGLGAWSEADFVAALRQGKNPRGEHYFPIFPYVSYTRMTDRDIRDLWAYLQRVPAVARTAPRHNAGLIFGSRFMVGLWKAFNFTPGPLPVEPGETPAWARGAYLIEALGHCGECHTPRGMLGGFETDMHLAGTKTGPDGESVPNITPDPETGIGRWSDDDLDTLFTIGMLSDGDFAGGSMGEVVENTAKLTSEDHRAMIVYLKSLPPIRNRIGKPKN